MNKTDELRREKARNLRFKKPMCNSINWYTIHEDLQEIQDTCNDIRWMNEEEELLIDLLGEDEAFEYRMAFTDLDAEAYNFYEELCEVRQYDFMSTDSDDEEQASLFDLFFPACRIKDSMSGYDPYESDYIRLNTYEYEFAQNEARKKLKQLTKDQLFDLSGLALTIARNYMSLMYRYDCLKSSIDILKGQNEGMLQMVKHIEELYTDWNRDSDSGKWLHTKAEDELDKALAELPERVWIE